MSTRYFIEKASGAFSRVRPESGAESWAAARGVLCSAATRQTGQLIAECKSSDQCFITLVAASEQWWWCADSAATRPRCCWRQLASHCQVLLFQILRKVLSILRESSEAPGAHSPLGCSAPWLRPSGQLLRAPSDGWPGAAGAAGAAP